MGPHGTGVGRRTRAAAAGKGRTAAGSVGGVRRAREAPSAASGAARRSPRERPLQHLTPVRSRLREIDAVGRVVCP